MRNSAVVALAILLLFASRVAAQNLLRQLTDPKAAPPSLDQTASWSRELDVDSKNGSDRVRAESVSLGLSVPVYGGSSHGLLLSPSVKHTDISTRRGLLPERLLSVGTTLFGYIGIERPIPIRFGSYLAANMRSDFHDPTGSDPQYIASVFALVPASDELYFTPGIGYTSDIAVPFLEKVPIPSIEVIWAPQDGVLGEANFLLAFGVPFTIVSFKATDWLSVSVFNLAGVLGRATVTAHVTQWLEIGAGVSSTAEVFDLTEPRFADESRLIHRDYRAGVNAEFKPGWGLTLAASWDYAFQRRWIVGQTIDFAVEERVDVKPGHVFGLSLTWSFSPFSSKRQQRTE